MNFRVVTVVGISLVIMGEYAEPCQCAEARDVREAADTAEEVFVGKVNRFERLEPWWRYARRYTLSWFYQVIGTDQPEWLSSEWKSFASSPQYGYRASFEVGVGWKRVRTGEVQVYTGMWEGDCGFRFERGREYLVYADADPRGRGLYTSTCHRTVELGHPGAGSDIPVLHKWEWERSKAGSEPDNNTLQRTGEPR